MKSKLTYKPLDEKIYKELRMVFNASPIFSNFEKYKDKYNLCCAVMDRLETAVKYINSNMEYPFEEESSLVTFVVYAFQNKR